MKKGEFRNLKGAGKPLPKTPTAYNPYVDFVTHKLNQVYCYSYGKQQKVIL